MKKPILFLISEEIPNTKLIDSYVSILGKKVINLDNISKIRDFNNYLHVDNVKYEKFIKDYIKLKGSPKKLSSDIIIEHLEKELIFK
jgi:acyl-ACP thioesterase